MALPGRETKKANVVNIEDALCSKTRLKILKVLVDSELTPSDLVKAVGANYENVNRHLEILEREGILEHKKFGKRIRFYRFNQTSPRARAVQNLIEAFQKE